jgi:hypothetical protein
MIVYFVILFIFCHPVYSCHPERSEGSPQTMLEILRRFAPQNQSCQSLAARGMKKLISCRQHNKFVGVRFIEPATGRINPTPTEFAFS